MINILLKNYIYIFLIHLDIYMENKKMFYMLQRI